MTTFSSPASSCHRTAGEEPVEITGETNRSSSAHNYEPLQGAGVTSITGITGITAACRVPIRPLPLPLSQPVPAENLTTNNGKNKPEVKAPRNSGGIPPAVLSSKLAISKPIENISSGSKPRRFSPQLVESTRRRRKSGDSGPTILPHDKTDVSPGTQGTPFESLKTSAGGVLPPASGYSSTVSTAEALSAAESRFSFSSLKKKELRQPSFQVPELPSIQSTGDSEGSNESRSPSRSATPIAASANNVTLQQTTEHQKTICDKPEGYLLALAAQAAEQKLREQAMAAYPNEKIHEPIDHFAAAREEGDGEDKAHIRGHKTFSVLGDQQTTLPISKMTPLRASQEQFSKPVEAVQDLKRVAGGPGFDTQVSKIDNQSSEMKIAVSPPLAGQDLQYPFCQSPLQTRFDVGQLYQERKPTDLDLGSGLWTPDGGASRKGSIHGLWMGTCAKSIEDSRTTHCVTQTGLLTPGPERDDPFQFSQFHRTEFPLSPSGSNDDCKLCCVNSVLSNEEKISEEFHDGFITQVYNYLSLGYPSMARKFDAELSEITKVPVEELRLDDGNVSANGYVGVPKRLGIGKEQTCPRWGALRTYVKEWARQQSPSQIPSRCHHHIGMKEGVYNAGDWGHLAKKGSWAI